MSRAKHFPDYVFFVSGCLVFWHWKSRATGAYRAVKVAVDMSPSARAVPAVITSVVDHDLCIGCGACVQACPSKALDVGWNEHGFLVAKQSGAHCDSTGSCIDVCPFNPDPRAGYKDEDGLAEDFLTDAKKTHKKVGKYSGIYVGYSKKFRETSSSGGIATYLYETLLERKLIDYVVTVGASEREGEHYQYGIFGRQEDLRSQSKTRYYPVTLATVLEKIKSLDGRVAISGVGCFIKSIRLAQNKDPVLKEKIVFLVGIICGGVKSSFFTEYLTSKSGIFLNNSFNPEYRVKDPDSIALDYGFSCEDGFKKSIGFIKMRDVGDMWGTGLFKANACDYCDDVTTELADISLGDAWLEPYNQDGRGNNIIISRTKIAEELLHQGLIAGDLEIESLPLDKLLLSQKGSFSHRHDGMSTRVSLAKSRGNKVPPVRPAAVDLPKHLEVIQRLRRRTRLKSLQAWKKSKNATDFDRNMKPLLMLLRGFTKASHAVRKMKRLLGLTQ